MAGFNLGLLQIQLNNNYCLYSFPSHFQNIPCTGNPIHYKYIPENDEKYITFNKNVLVDTITRGEKEIKIYTRLKFLDTFRFMSISLEKLVKNIDRFEHTSKYFKAEQLELLRRK